MRARRLEVREVEVTRFEYSNARLCWDSIRRARREHFDLEHFSHEAQLNAGPTKLSTKTAGKANVNRMRRVPISGATSFETTRYKGRYSRASKQHLTVLGRHELQDPRQASLRPGYCMEYRLINSWR